MVSSLYPPHALGGYELACSDVVDRWRDDGHEVTVLTSSARLDGVRDPPEEPRVHRKLTLLSDVPEGQKAPAGRVRVKKAVARDHFALRSCVRRARPQVISVWHPGGLAGSLLSRLGRSRLPVVYVVCDYWPEYARKKDARSPLRQRLRSREVVFCSQALRGALDGAFPVSHADVVPLGVNLEQFPRSHANDRPWRWRLLYVGRVSPEKGIETAVRALGHLPDEATLDIIGRREEGFVDHLRVIAGDVGAASRVRFEVAPREDLAARYTGADALVFPSEWDEPFGIVPLEAMACGTPVVATGTGGSGEYLEDSANCLLFPPGDAAALARSLGQLAGDSQLRRRLANRGRSTAEALTTDRLAAKLESIHLELSGAH